MTLHHDQSEIRNPKSEIEGCSVSPFTSHVSRAEDHSALRNVLTLSQANSKFEIRNPK